MSTKLKKCFIGGSMVFYKDTQWFNRFEKEYKKRLKQDNERFESKAFCLFIDYFIAPQEGNIGCKDMKTKELLLTYSHGKFSVLKRLVEKIRISKCQIKESPEHESFFEIRPLFQNGRPKKTVYDSCYLGLSNPLRVRTVMICENESVAREVLQEKLKTIAKGFKIGN